MVDYPIDPRIQSKVVTELFKAVHQYQEAQQVLLTSEDFLELVERERNARQALLQSGALVRAANQMTISATAAKSLVETANELEQSLTRVAVDLDIPSIQADLHAVSRTQDRSPATDVDQIRPPAERIHDKVVWEDGEWYREKLWGLAVDIVDHILWNIEDKGRIGNTSDWEMGLLAMGLIAVVGLILTMGTATALYAGAGGTITFGTMRAAGNRTERRDLDERFG